MWLLLNDMKVYVCYHAVYRFLRVWVIAYLHSHQHFHMLIALRIKISQKSSTADSTDVYVLLWTRK